MVEGTGLENRQWETIRGFESHSLRQIRQGPRKGPLSCLGVKGGVDEAAGSTNSSGTNLDSRMAGPSAWREGEAQGRAEHIPLSPPDTTRAPQGAFVVSGAEKALAEPWANPQDARETIDRWLLDQCIAWVKSPARMPVDRSVDWRAWPVMMQRGSIGQSGKLLT